MKIKKAIKILLILLFCIILASVFFVALLFNKIAKVSAEVSLDITKLTTAGQKITFVDSENNEYDMLISNSAVKLDDLNQYTIDSFTSIEDKTFFKHHGINYKRTIAAALKNLVNRKFVEGGSTITQQLIKNTHLSSEKTIDRKLREFALAKKLEKNYNKNQILETYLNVIYFGDNCYGISDASVHYFSKNCNNLSLSESATLAGIIKAPSTYSPTKNIENCTKRRNLVLKEMLKDKKITNEEYNDAIQEEINLNLSEINKIEVNSYENIALQEAKSILGLTEKQIACNNIKIYTNKNNSLQKKLQQEIQKEKQNLKNKNLDYDISNIIINNKTGNIEAYYSSASSDVDSIYRQPGSSIKPILVYGSALENNLITPSTLILDEETDFNGYKPHNYNNTYNGYVSVRTSMEKSLNIPAVKVLNYIGVEKAIQFAEKNGIHFDPDDNNLAVALGGLTYGENLKCMANSYQAIANGGNYIPSSCISKIESENGSILFKQSHISKQTMREDTSDLLIDMLKTTTQNGTARKLSSLPFEIASKTGTVSLKNSNLNTDAYNFAFTSEHTFGCWYGNISGDNLSKDISGSSYPTSLNKNIIEFTYKNEKPADFVLSDKTTKLKIDTNQLKENNIVVLAPEFLPDRYTQTELFSIYNLPNENLNFYESNFTITPNFKQDDIEISFNTSNCFLYEIYLNNELIDTVKDKTENFSYQIDNTLLSKNNEIYVNRKFIDYSTNDILFETQSNILKYYNYQYNNNSNTQAYYESKNEKSNKSENKNLENKTITNDFWFF